MPQTNVKTRWVDGNLTFYDVLGNVIAVVDGTNSAISTALGVRSSTEDTYALTAIQSGLVYIGTKASATQIISLPLPTKAGLVFTFVCGSAAGEINVDPGAATYKINGPGITVVATKDLKNTAATNVLGDLVTIVSDGVDTWWATAISGTWATT